ncbi:conserved hypothetical protein [uncultured Sporomusa sp.]|uniref:Metal-binding protein n=1 Tax=uncultured Sporomusa sp. TaxID=307249 RepID=A0A212LY26_9FIRM|nr:DUF2284 domain-containing protein [uncultured Sporomusa sp.]SCM82416.1 conserved hypothetical protein [uncultured Sporomusa sp.]
MGIECNYTTTSGAKYPLDFFFFNGMSNQLVYQPDVVREWCRIGCSNYGIGGGCPPRAPLYETIVQSNKEIFLFACKFDSIYKPQSVANSNNIAIHWKFQDGILARAMNNLGHLITEKYGGRFLATGYCMGCPGKKCSFKLGEAVCRNPIRRTYSMEATGINVVETVKRNFDINMYWYKKGKTDVPYMLKVILWIPPDIQTNCLITDQITNLISGIKSIELR